MKIALTYDINKDEIWQHFGQTNNFVIYDTESHEKNIINNGGFSHRDLIPYLKSLDINLVICGGIGDMAVYLLNSNNIDVIPGVSGNIDNVIKLYLDNNLVGDKTVIHKCGNH